MKYLVEIIPESLTDLPGAASRLAQTLKLDPAKAAALLKRNPVTKPVSQEEAEKVARLFTKAGIEVFIRSEEEVMEVAEVPSPPEIPQPSVRIVTNPVPFERTTLDDVPVPSKTTPSPEIQHSIPDLTADFNETSQPELDSDVTTPHLDSGYTSPARLPSVVPETTYTSSLRSEAEIEDVSKPNTLHINTMHGDETLKIPQGFFTPVPESEAETLESPETNVSAVSTPSRSGNLGKIAFASVVPGLLALAGILTALYLLGLPFLRSQQRVAAETTAISLANSIGGWIGDASLTNPTLSGQVQSVITRTQAELRPRDIDFVLLSDAEGNQLAGWFKDLPTPGVPETVTNTEEVSNEISNAVRSIENASPTTLVVDGETLGLASAAVRQGTTPVGAVVVASSQQNLSARLRDPLTTIVLAGALPLLLGILISLLIGRSRS